MKILSDKYSQTLKTLHVRFNDVTEKELKKCFDYISQFENLRLLELTFCSTKSTEPIDDCLSLIGQKCTKLTKLDLSIRSSVPISHSFFDVFSRFIGIKKLKIWLSHNTVLSGSVECFKHCKQLTELDISYPELTEDFFANIELFVPKLQKLHISADKQFSDSFKDSLHSLKYIRKVEINFLNEVNRMFETRFWIFDRYSEADIGNRGGSMACEPSCEQSCS